MNQNQNAMSPEDMRNLIIFCAVSLVLYLGYEHFVMGPQREALEKVKQSKQQAQITQVVSQGTTQAIAPKPREDIVQSGARIIIENNEVQGSILLQGARLDDIALKHFYETREEEETVKILSPKESAYPRYVEQGWVTADQGLAVPTSRTLWQAQGNQTLTPTSPVTITWDNGQNITFTRTYTIDDKNLITLTQNVQNASGKAITLFPYALVSQRGLPAIQQGTWILHEGPIGFIGDDLHETKYKKLRKASRIEHSAAQGWTGITDKYWLTSVIPPQGQTMKYAFSYTGTPPEKGQKDTGLYQADYTGEAITIAPGANTQIQSHIFSGPKRVLELERYEEQLGLPSFDIAVNFGRLWMLSKPFFYALHYLGELTGNFGIAIIIFTFIVRTAVFPLTNASFKSFAKMKKVGPKIAELRKDHGDDKQRMQKELMEMYQKEGVNPLAGCIPMVIQIPIFFALYRVLFITIEMRHAPFFGWVQDLSAPDPTSVFNAFGLIPWDPPAMLHIGVWPCLMLLSMIVQRKLNPPPQDPLQRDMATYFPFIMAYMMSRFASGLVIYWTFSAFFSVMQQMFIMKRMNVPIYLFSKDPAEKKIQETSETKDALLEDKTDDTPKPAKKKPKKKK